MAGRLSLTLFGQLLNIQPLEEILDSRLDVLVSLYLDLIKREGVTLNTALCPSLPRCALLRSPELCTSAALPLILHFGNSYKLSP